MVDSVIDAGIFNLRRLRAKFLDGGGAGLLDEKGRAKVAHTLKVPDRDVESMDMRLLAHDFSLNAPVAEDNDSEWQDFPADEGPGPEDIVTGARRPDPVPVDSHGDG